MAGSGIKIMARNQKARHEYFIDETFETGIELVGTEVKSIRAGTLSLKEAWCQIKDGEIFIKQMHIAPYEKGNIFNKDPLRVRRLLLHKVEIRKLLAKSTQKGYTIVPIKVYLKGKHAKVEIALAKGKKLFDKRHDIAAKDQKREAERDFKIKLV
jgi:SsrA-binding protein